jgi:hypothetical protein
VRTRLHLRAPHEHHRQGQPRHPLRSQGLPDGRQVVADPRLRH